MVPTWSSSHKVPIYSREGRPSMLKISQTLQLQPEWIDNLKPDTGNGKNMYFWFLVELSLRARGCNRVCLWSRASPCYLQPPASWPLQPQEVTECPVLWQPHPVKGCAWITFHEPVVNSYNFFFSFFFFLKPMFCLKTPWAWAGWKSQLLPPVCGET